MDRELNIITNLDDLYEDEPDTLATIFKSIKKIDSNEETINAIFRNENSRSASLNTFNDSEIGIGSFMNIQDQVKKPPKKKSSRKIK